MIEIVGTSFWVVLIVAGIVALGLVIGMRRFLRSVSAVLGMLYVVGIVVLAWSLLPVSASKSSSDIKESASKDGASLIDFTSQKSAVVNASSDQTSAWLDLSKDRNPIDEFINAAHAKSKIPVLYAGNGVDGFYTEKVTDLYGSLVAADQSESQPVCFAPRSVLGFRSGLCQAREIPLFLQRPAVASLASDLQGRVVAATAFVTGKPVVLLTYRVGVVNSAEESCLIDLSAGGTCITPTLFPSHTQHILVVNPGPFEDEFASFGLSIPKSDQSCAALFEKRIPASEPHDVANGFSEIKSELDLNRFVEDFLRGKNFAPLSYLKLEHLKHFEAGSSREKAIIRSLLTKLLRTPVWLTDCEDIAARLAGFNNLQLASDKGSAVEIKGADAVSALKLVMTSPSSVSSQSLAQFSMSGASGWSVGVVNARSAQVLIPRASSKLSIHIPKAVDSPFSTNQDTRLILLFALMFGGVASLLQTVAVPKQRQRVGFHVGTALPVAVLFFVSIWYSYQASLASGTGSDAVTDLTTGLQMPLPVAEVPESFFKGTGQPMSEGIADRLEKLLALIPNTPETKLKLIKRETPSYKFSYSQKMDVIVHNSIAARNYFYRKSPTYSAAVSAIEQVLSEKKITFKIVDDDDLLTSLQGKPAVLIVTDVRFLPADAVSGIDTWIKEGGVLLFNDQLDAVSPSVVSPFTEILQSEFGSAYANIETASWSKFGFVSGELDVDHSHRVIPVKGTAKSALLGQKSGIGALVFFGVQPFSKNSALLFEHVVKNLTGQTLQSPTGKDCNTLLVVEPYQLTKQEYQAMSVSAGDQIIGLGIDGQSFPNMVDQWGDKKESIVAIDDGQWRQRYLVHEIFRTWWSLPSVFLRRDSDNFSQQGPEAHVLLARYGFSKADAANEMVQEWRQGCVSGYANPRIVSANWLKKNVGALTAAMTKAGLHSMKPQDLADAAAKVTSSEETIQSYATLKSDPLNFTEEVAK